MVAAIVASDPFVSGGSPGVVQRSVFRGMTWSQYRALATAFTGSHVRLTYDRGTLEFLTVSPEHGFLCSLLSQIVVILAKASGFRRRSCGDMTCDREDLERGFEPDQCFYLMREEAVRGRMALDLRVDPPPDLGIEVDLTTDARTRLPLYAALGVPEVWQFKNERMRFYVLRGEGRYELAEASAAFPRLTPAILEGLLEERTRMGEDELIERFQRWVDAGGQVEER